MGDHKVHEAQLVQGQLPAPVMYGMPAPIPERSGVGRFLLEQFVKALGRACYLLAKPIPELTSSELLSEQLQTDLAKLEEIVDQLSSLTDFPNPKLIAFCRNELSRLRRQENLCKSITDNKWRSFAQWGSEDVGAVILRSIREMNALGEVSELLKGLAFVAKSVPHQLRHGLAPKATIADAMIISSSDLNRILTKGRRLTLRDTTVEELELFGNLLGLEVIRGLWQNVTIALQEEGSGDGGSDLHQVLEEWQTELTQLALPNLGTADHPWIEGVRHLQKGSKIFALLEKDRVLVNADGMTFRGSQLRNLKIRVPRGLTLSNWSLTNTLLSHLSLNGHLNGFTFTDCQGETAITGLVAENAVIENTTFTRTHLINVQLKTVTYRHCTFDGVIFRGGYFHHVVFESCRITNTLIEGALFDGSLSLSGYHSKFVIASGMFGNETHFTGSANGLTFREMKNMLPRLIMDELEIVRWTIENSEPTDRIPNRDKHIAAGRLVITHGDHKAHQGAGQESRTEVVEVCGDIVLKTTTDTEQGLLQTARTIFQKIHESLWEWRPQLIAHRSSREKMAELLFQIGQLPILWSDIEALLLKMQTFTDFESTEFLKQCDRAISGSMTLGAAVDKIKVWLAEDLYMAYDESTIRQILAAKHKDACKANEKVLEGDLDFRQVLEQGIDSADRLRSWLEEHMPHLLPIRLIWLQTQVSTDSNDRTCVDLERVPHIVADIWTHNRKGLQQVLEERHGKIAAFAIQTFPREMVYGEVTGGNIRSYVNDLLEEAGDQAEARYFSQDCILAVVETNRFRRDELPYADLVTAAGIDIETNIYRTVLAFAEKGPNWRRVHLNRQQGIYEAYIRRTLDITDQNEIKALLRRYHGKLDVTFEDFSDVWDRHSEFANFEYAA